MEAIARPLLQRLQAALEGGGGPGEVSVLLEHVWEVSRKCLGSV